MGQGLVTIGIPTRNRAAFLREAVASAQRQTYPHLEILVVDNASTDETAQLVTAVTDRRFRFVRSETDLGMTGTFNRVLDLARGDYVVCLCDDDWLDPAFVDAALGVFHKFPALGLVACPVVARDSTRRELWRYALRGGEYIPSRDMWHRMVTHQNEIGMPSGVMLARAAIAAVGRFDPAFPWLADWDYWIRVFARFPIGYVPRHLAAWRQHGEAASGSGPSSLALAQVRLGTLKKAFAMEQCPLTRIERWRCAGRAAGAFVGESIKAVLTLRWRRARELAGAIADHFSLPALIAHFVLTAPAAAASGLRRRVMMWRGLPFTMS
jgi:glycosyltransferase involved in cell wall biosynthesis